MQSLIPGQPDYNIPRSLIVQLGLTVIGSRKARTTNGIVDLNVYSAVRLTVLERSGIPEVTDVPDNVPVNCRTHDLGDA